MTFNSRLETSSDVLDYDRIDIEASVLSFETPGGAPSLVVTILTGMQLDTSEGWITAGVSSALNAVGKSSTFTLSGNFLRYIRWGITSVGTQAAHTVWVKGIGRKFNESQG